jgi:hypothetical protein
MYLNRFKMNDTKRLQELAGIKQQYIFNNIIDDFIKRDNPKILDYGDSSKYTRGFRLKPQSSLFYDLGGGEGPIESPNNIVVDDWDGGYEEGEEIHSFIQADLDEFVELQPVSAINATFSVAYMESTPVAKTIDQALKPGGILNIADHADSIANVMKNLQNYKLVELKVSKEDYEHNNNRGNPGNCSIGCVFIK